MQGSRDAKDKERREGGNMWVVDGGGYTILWKKNKRIRALPQIIERLKGWRR
jgi:hypothetical protein